MMMKKKWYNLLLLLNLQFLFLVTFLLRNLIRVLPKLKKKSKNLLILESMPIENAGYQYRAFKWVEYLEKLEWNVKVLTVIKSKERYNSLLLPENTPLYLIISMWVRLYQILGSFRYSHVIVRRELLQFNDYGNCFMEKLLITIHPHLILDIDDNISEAKNEPRQILSWFGKINAEDGSKFMHSLSYYKSFIIGTPHLQDFVKAHRPFAQDSDFCFIPTCVDYDRCSPKEYRGIKHEIEIGWIGGVGNLSYLDLVIPALNKLATHYTIRLNVLSGQDYVPSMPHNFPIVNLPWSLNLEVEIIRNWDLGLMPLPDSELTRGKAGFKLLQYMGLGLVSIANDVGINAEIVMHGVNGFLVHNQEDWYNVFREAVESQSRWTEISQNARNTVFEKYSFTSNVIKYAAFLNER